MNNNIMENNSKYQEFIKNNSGSGNLKIRAYAANGAIPIQNMNVVVSTIIDDNNVVFFDGYTDESGMIQNISLPTPSIDSNNLNIPASIFYYITVSYEPENYYQEFKINMYDGICVVQNIVVLPNNIERRYYGN